jgi:hypothetical protein
MFQLRRMHFVMLASAASASIILAIAILFSNNTQSNYSPQQTSNSAFATAASEQLPSTVNNDTLLPADYDDLTTFELFEKYPYLHDVNWTADIDSTLANETTASNTTMSSLANSTASAATTDSLIQKMEELKKARDNIIAEYSSQSNATAASLPPSHSFIENITETVNSLQQVVSSMNETVNSLDKVADKLDSAATELNMAASNLSALAESQNASSASTSSAEDNTSQNSLPPINITITANPSANVSLGDQSPMTLEENGSSVNATSGMVDNNYHNDQLRLHSNSSSSITSGNDLITSSAKRLTGELEDGDYLIVADLSPYRTTQGSSHLALKVPCNNQGEPKVALLTGIAPDSLQEIDLGEPVGQNDVAISNGDEIQLSDNGDYCLYHTELPAGTSDVLVFNNSGDAIDFSDGRYYVALTAQAAD